MKPISLQQVRAAVSGKLLAPLIGELPMIHFVCTNSRQMEKSSVFVALRGDRFDAHTFVPQAATEGAVAAIVQTPPPVPIPDFTLIVVPDTRIALGKLAKFVRRQMRSKVIAVAGSNGKTSTKLLIDACLRGRLRGSVSPRSYNNDIGVPLSIFPADPGQDYLVLEMGTNHPGEIRTLTNMATPDIGVITNCSAEHLEGLGDLMGVRRENASLVEGLAPNGLLVVNGDDPELLSAVAGYAGRKITFGFKPTNDIFATDIECTEAGTRFSLNGRNAKVFVPLLGRHTAANALAAIAVGRRMGLTETEIIENLARATGPEMRLQLQDYHGIRVLNDAYNANPASMKAAIETLAALPAAGRRIAIVGDMRELGDAAPRLHKEIADFIATIALDLLVCVGPYTRIIADTVSNKWNDVQEAGQSGRSVLHFADAAAATAIVSQIVPGDVVLLKASRGIGLEIVGQAIAKSAIPSLRAAS